MPELTLELWSWLGGRTPGEILALGLATALVMEALTLALRFGCGMKSSHHTCWIGRCTRGVRIHHGYPGLAIAPVGIALGLGVGTTALGAAIAILGIGLLVSDLLHHFVALRLLTGDHEFDLRYPQ